MMRVLMKTTTRGRWFRGAGVVRRMCKIKSC